MNEECLRPTCEDNLESKVYEEIYKSKRENGVEQQEVYDQLHRRINELENRLSVALRVIDRDFVKKEVKENEK